MEDYVVFSKKIINSSDFLSLSTSTRSLYFLLCSNAKRNGEINNVYSLAKSNFNKKGDIESLINKNYIKKIKEPCTYKITHWQENNGFYEQSKERKTSEYQKWRKLVIERDKKCVLCGNENDLHAHHIKSFSKYPVLRTVVCNGITLCKKCHRKIHKRENENA